MKDGWKEGKCNTFLLWNKIVDQIRYDLQNRQSIFQSDMSTRKNTTRKSECINGISSFGTDVSNISKTPFSSIDLAQKQSIFFQQLSFMNVCIICIKIVEYHY